MSRGKIEQTGTPQEIYRTPRTRFVAEFLGSSNIFPGKVIAAAAGAMRIATPVGEFHVADTPARQLSAGDKATFSISSDRIQLTPERPSGEWNCLEASVVGEEFVGATAVVHLEASGHIEIKAQKSHEELDRLRLEPGGRIWVSWRPEASHILPGET